METINTSDINERKKSYKTMFDEIMKKIKSKDARKRGSINDNDFFDLIPLEYNYGIKLKELSFVVVLDSVGQIKTGYYETDYNDEFSLQRVKEIVGDIQLREILQFIPDKTATAVINTLND